MPLFSIDYINKMTQQEARAFVRKVTGPPKRRLEGKELENIWSLLQLTTPYSESNNQRTWTDEYLIGSKRYDVIYGLEDDPVVEVHEDDTDI